MTLAYQILALNQDGTTTGYIHNPLTITATRSANSLGAFEIVLPWQENIEALGPDNIIVINRRGYHSGYTTAFVGLLRYWRWRTNDQGSETVTLKGPCINDLLARRIVAYAAGTAQAQMTDQIDDMMKAIVADNLGGDAAAARQLTDWLTVEGNTTAGASITKAFAWRNMLTVLQDLGQIGQEQGNKVFFEVAWLGGADLRFRTALDYLGTDHSYGSTAAAGSPLVFSQEFGNLSTPDYELDYRDEVTYVYAGGQGEGSDRTIVEVEDTDRSARSEWGRMEAFQDARNLSTDTAITSEANARLQTGRPRLRFTGQVLDTPSSRFGVDWNFGDKVTAQYNRQAAPSLVFDGVIESVTVRLHESGQDEVIGRLVVEDVL